MYCNLNVFQVLQQRQSGASEVLLSTEQLFYEWLRPSAEHSTSMRVGLKSFGYTTLRTKELSGSPPLLCRGFTGLRLYTDN